MSSIQSSFSQNRSNRLVVVGSSAYMYTLSAVKTAFGTKGSTVGSLYTASSITNYVAFAVALDGYTTWAAGALSLYDHDTLVDMGSEIVVGVAGGESALLKLRLVKNTLTASTGVAGDGASIGYVVVENNAYKSTVASNTTSLPVRVSRL